jgi:type II secretory pathway component PulJ
MSGQAIEVYDEIMSSREAKKALADRLSKMQIRIDVLEHALARLTAPFGVEDDGFQSDFTKREIRAIACKALQDKSHL